MMTKLNSILTKKNWAKFSFIQIFEIKKGFYNKRPRHFDSNQNKTIPFLSGTNKNNGISQFYSVDEIRASSRTGSEKNEELSAKIYNGNCIIVTNNGSVGHAYYQKNRFTCSHDVNPLYLKNHLLNKHIALFLITAIERQKVCFEYARKWRPKRMKKSFLMLPVNKNNEPDYQFMEDYISEYESLKIDKYIKHINKRISCLEVKNKNKFKELIWHEFAIEEIAEIYSGVDIYKDKRQKGEIPYITSTSMNNGISHYISNRNSSYESHCISVNRNGSVGYAFYHPYYALFSNDCRKLKLKGYNSKYVALFIINQITSQRSKFCYGYKMGTKRLKNQKILLPICKDKTLNYNFMENFMLEIEYHSILKYLKHSKRR